MRNVNSILGRNRRILRQLSPQGKTVVVRDRLLILGFDFDYFTGSHTTKSGEFYRFCYDLGYMELADQQVLIVERIED